MTTIDTPESKSSNETSKKEKNLVLDQFDSEDLKGNNGSHNNNITELDPFINNINKTMPSHTNTNNTESNILPSAVPKFKDENITKNVEENENQGLCF